MLLNPPKATMNQHFLYIQN